MSGETVVTVVGNAVADAELRLTASGVAVANFTVASTPRHFDKAKNEFVDDEALFMRCAIWRQPAENVAETITRGMRIIVVGRLKQRSYEKDGEKRTVIELEVDEVGPALKFASAKVNKVASSNDSHSRAGNGQSPRSAPASDPWGSTPAEYTDEPPF